MTYNFSSIKHRIEEIEEWFRGELSGIHTGRAMPAVLDNVRVDSYGSKMSIAHIANISIEDARTLRVIPWEKDNIRAIEVAINDAELGLSVSVDANGVRVSFPELTGEKRTLLAKTVGKKLEDSRVSIKKEREETWEDIQKKERGGELSEDDKFRLKEELQKLIDEGNNKLGEIAKKKEKEILQ